jgi:serine/threonine-protein kinase
MPLFLGTVIALFSVPFVDAHPTAIKATMIALAIGALGYAALFFVTRDPDRVDDAKIAVISQTQALAAVGLTYACGIFSLWPGVIAMGLYVYCLGAPRRFAIATLVNVVVCHAVIAVLILTETVDDVATFRVVDGLDPTIAWLTQASILGMFVVVFGVARYSHGIAVHTVHELEAAVRMVAHRQAMLEEAKQELRRSAWVGGPGRFSEQVFGEWEIGSIIGRGGMGEVYDAHHADTGELAALKVLNRGMMSDPDAIARFVREARIAAALKVPEVVRFIDVGHEPIPYIVMEKLRGHDLAHHLREDGTLPSNDVAVLVDQVARGLEAARHAGIVHRDIKPRNLFLSDDTKGWKILDFGVSKLLDDDVSLTRSKLVGTPQYMSPEQAAGEGIDHRCDVYSLAVIAYRCITGRAAFAGGTLAEIIYRVMNELPMRPSQASTVPLAMDDVLRVGLAKTPADRFQTATELANALVSAIEGLRDPAVAARAAALDATRTWGD